MKWPELVNTGIQNWTEVYNAVKAGLAVPMLFAILTTAAVDLYKEERR